MKTQSGFTYIELLITLSIIAICFLPLMRMFSTAVEQVSFTRDLATAMFLGQEEMERVKNLNFTKEQIKIQGDIYNPPLAKPALTINQRNWRILRQVRKGSDPLEVRVMVFIEPDLKKPVVELATLIEDLA